MGRTGDSEFDVIVSGGGLTGVVCAVQLARSGRRVGLVERRGTLGWEIGRAGVFLDLKRWSEHSPILRELEGRLAREKAEVGKALSAPVVEFVLDAWVMEERDSTSLLLATGTCRHFSGSCYRNHRRQQARLHAANSAGSR